MLCCVVLCQTLHPRPHPHAQTCPSPLLMSMAPLVVVGIMSGCGAKLHLQGSSRYRA